MSGCTKFWSPLELRECTPLSPRCVLNAQKHVSGSAIYMFACNSVKYELFGFEWKSHTVVFDFKEKQGVSHVSLLRFYLKFLRLIAANPTLNLCAVCSDWTTHTLTTKLPRAQHRL
jgi:hypothetical protein